jgi:lipopolysaccharide/colanic/teichoic acid biosynthesis glycosyltransferase
MREMSKSAKRLIDFTTALLGLIVFSPVLCVISLAILAIDGAPVFFRQVRPGLNGGPFTLVKFRTMRESDTVGGQPLPDSERLTRLGRFLRRTSFDELPQLWNVLTGDLSLVGPRPLLMQYLPLYSAKQRRRHEVKPGITGWAQINGRNDISWEEKLRHDVWYVDNWSLRLDIRILMTTVLKVVRREGITPADSENVEFFKGSPQQHDEGRPAKPGLTETGR